MKKTVHFLYGLLILLAIQACTGTHFFDKPLPGNTDKFPESFQGKYLATQPLWKSIFGSKTKNDTLYLFANAIRLGNLDTTIQLKPENSQLSQLDKTFMVVSFKDDQHPEYWNIIVMERNGNKLRWFPMGNFPWDKDPLRKYLNVMRVVKSNDVLQQGIINNLNDSLIREAYSINNSSDTILYYEMNAELFKKCIRNEHKKLPSLDFKKIHPKP